MLPLNVTDYRLSNMTAVAPVLLPTKCDQARRDTEYVECTS